MQDIPKSNSLLLKVLNFSTSFILSGMEFHINVPLKKTEFDPYLTVFPFGRSRRFDVLKLKDTSFCLKRSFMKHGFRSCWVLISVNYECIC